MEQVDLFDKYCDQNRMWHFEGARGVRNLEKVVSEVCGYDGNWGNVLETFLQDNPGAVEAVVNWIREANCLEWRQNLEELVEEELDEAEE